MDNWGMEQKRARRDRKSLKLSLGLLFIISLVEENTTQQLIVSIFDSTYFIFIYSCFKQNNLMSVVSHFEIVKGELYMWGKASNGCLGRADVKEVVCALPTQLNHD